jgi:hypothetical protein
MGREFYIRAVLVIGMYGSLFIIVGLLVMFAAENLCCDFSEVIQNYFNLRGQNGNIFSTYENCRIKWKNLCGPNLSKLKFSFTVLCVCV